MRKNIMTFNKFKSIINGLNESNIFAEAMPTAEKTNLGGNTAVSLTKQISPLANMYVRFLSELDKYGIKYEEREVGVGRISLKIDTDAVRNIIPLEKRIELNEMCFLALEMWMMEFFTDSELNDIKNDVHQKVEIAKTMIIRNPNLVFFETMLVRLEYLYVYSNEYRTAATGGSSITINPFFFYSMTRNAICFVILHEILHCVFLHFLRAPEGVFTIKKRHRLWNIATDNEINLRLAEEVGIDVKKDPHLWVGVYDEEYRDMSAEQIYDIMFKDAKDNEDGPPSPNGGDKDGGGTGGGTGGDGTDGDYTDGNDKDGNDTDGGGTGGGTGGDGTISTRKKGTRGNDSNDGDGFDGGTEVIIDSDNLGKTTSGLGEVISPEEEARIYNSEGKQRNEELKPNQEDWDAVIREGLSKDEMVRKKRNAGDSGSAKSKYGSRLIDLINKEYLQRLSRGKVNWKNTLKRYIGQITTEHETRIPKRRYMYREDVRSYISEKASGLENVVVAIDTSGSMLGSIPKMFEELNGLICDKKVAKKTTVLYWDDKLYKDNIAVITKNGRMTPDPIMLEKAAEKVTGGSSTYIMPALSYINENIKNVELLVIFTDGEIFDRSQVEGLKKYPWMKKTIWLIYNWEKIDSFKDMFHGAAKVIYVPKDLD